MNKKYRKQLQAFVPDVSTITDIEETDVVVLDLPEVEALDEGEAGYRCLSCFAVFTKAELHKKDPDHCTECNEDSVQEI